MDEQLQYSGTDKCGSADAHQGFDSEYAVEHAANQRSRHIGEGLDPVYKAVCSLQMFLLHQKGNAGRHRRSIHGTDDREQYQDSACKNDGSPSQTEA